MSRFTSHARSSLPALVALSLYACSLQDFDYLQEGEAGASTDGGKGGKGGTTGANAGSSGSGGSGGSSGSGASGGTPNPSGGSAGEEAGQGGQAGTAGASGEGGAPAGGTSAGMTAAGGVPSAGQAGEGGVPTGAGGDPVASGGSGGEPPSEGGVGGQPPLVGNLLTNPGFELQLAGWTIEPATAISARHIYTQPPNPENYTASSLATWHATAEYSIFVSQTITGLEPGTYTFQGWFSSTSTREAYMFARNCGEADIRVDIPAVMYEWFMMEIPSFTVSSDSCEVGFFVHGVPEGNNGMPDWLNADQFSFEKDP